MLTEYQHAMARVFDPRRLHTLEQGAARLGAFAVLGFGPVEATTYIAEVVAKHATHTYQTGR